MQLAGTVWRYAETPPAGAAVGSAVRYVVAFNPDFVLDLAKAFLQHCGAPHGSRWR